jgi:hypothetical protein
MEGIISLDIDLRGVAAYSDIRGVILNGDTDEIPYEEMLKHQLVLVEIASPIFYGRNSKGSMTNRFKWAIYNSCIAGVIYTYLKDKSVKLLVSPSSSWTLGYTEEQRCSIANVAGNNHDIRECRCMQFFYKTNPGKWVSFEHYLSEL